MDREGAMRGPRVRVREEGRGGEEEEEVQHCIDTCFTRLCQLLFLEPQTSVDGKAPIMPIRTSGLEEEDYGEIHRQAA